MAKILYFTRDSLVGTNWATEDETGQSQVLAEQDIVIVDIVNKVDPTAELVWELWVNRIATGQKFSSNVIKCSSVARMKLATPIIIKKGAVFGFKCTQASGTAEKGYLAVMIA